MNACNTWPALVPNCTSVRTYQGETRFPPGPTRSHSPSGPNGSKATEALPVPVVASTEGDLARVVSRHDQHLHEVENLVCATHGRSGATDEPAGGDDCSAEIREALHGSLESDRVRLQVDVEDRIGRDIAVGYDQGLLP